MTKKLDIVVVRRAAQCSHACLPPSALYDVVQSGADGKTKKPAGKGKKIFFSFVFFGGGGCCCCCCDCGCIRKSLTTHTNAGGGDRLEAVMCGGSRALVQRS